MKKMINIRTSKNIEMIDITKTLEDELPAKGIGVCFIFSRHTTAGLTINENADPDVTTDIITQLNKMIPVNSSDYMHREGNSAAHIKASLLGFSLSVPIVDGRFELGTWQGIYFCEFDGPRRRSVSLFLSLA